MPVFCLFARRYIPYVCFPDPFTQDHGWPRQGTGGGTQEPTFLEFSSAVSSAASSRWFQFYRKGDAPSSCGAALAPGRQPSPLLDCSVQSQGVRTQGSCDYLRASPPQFDISNLPTLWGKKLISGSSFDNKDKDNGNWGCSEDRGEKKIHTGNSLVVPWLGLWGFTARACGAIPGRETKISQVMHGGQKTNKQTHKEPRMLLDPEQVINVN